jgi:hypothetical protein
MMNIDGMMEMLRVMSIDPQPVFITPGTRQKKHKRDIKQLKRKQRWTKKKARP